MKKIIFLCLVFSAVTAKAACTPSTAGLGLCLPNYGDWGYEWAKSSRANFVTLNAISTNVTTGNFVKKTGDLMSGPLIIDGNITAYNFFGNGSGMSGIPGAGSTSTWTGTNIFISTSNVFKGDGSELTNTGLSTPNRVAFYLSSDPIFSTYYTMYSSYTPVGATDLSYTLSSAGGGLDFWVTKQVFTNGDYAPDGKWSLDFCGGIMNASPDTVGIYSHVYIRDDSGGLRFIGSTSTATIVASSSCYTVSMSTGFIPLHNGAGLYKGDAVLLQLRYSKVSIGITPTIKLFFGDGYYPNFSMPSYVDNSRYVPYTNAQGAVDFGLNNVTVGGTLITNGINAGAVNATSVGNTFTTYMGDGSGLSGVAALSGNNRWTGLNEFTNQTTFGYKSLMNDIDMMWSSTPTLRGIDNSMAAFKPILIYPGIQINSAYDYPFNWLKFNVGGGAGPASFEMESYNNYNSFIDKARLRFDNTGLKLSGGLWAGGGDPWGYRTTSPYNPIEPVHIIGEDGRIPDISTTTFASLDGSHITNLPSDPSKVSTAGATMSGQLNMTAPLVITDPDLRSSFVMDGPHKQSMKIDNRHASATTGMLGELYFLQNGTGKMGIYAYGDTHATYPKEMQIGAISTSLGTNVRITGSSNLNPDLFVSSWTSVGVNKSNPNSSYKLDVNGNINASGVYVNGVPVGSGGVGEVVLSATQTFTGINTFGNVGIGMTNPARMLHVNGSANIATALYVGVGSGYGVAMGQVNEIWYGNEANSEAIGYINYRGYAEGTTQYRDLYIGNGKAAAIAYFDGSAGNVGIGTVSPATKLDVVGGITAAGQINANGGIEMGRVVVSTSSSVRMAIMTVACPAGTRTMGVLQAWCNGGAGVVDIEATDNAFVLYCGGTTSTQKISGTCAKF